jgi:hypothetical protein
MSDITIIYFQFDGFLCVWNEDTADIRIARNKEWIPFESVFTPDDEDSAFHEIARAKMRLKEHHRNDFIATPNMRDNAYRQCMNDLFVEDKNGVYILSVWSDREKNWTLAEPQHPVELY